MAGAAFMAAVGVPLLVLLFPFYIAVVFFVVANPFTAASAGASEKKYSSASGSPLLKPGGPPIDEDAGLRWRKGWLT
jgi:hypothetical protein